MDPYKAYPIGSALNAEEWAEWVSFYEEIGQYLPYIKADRHIEE